MLFKVWKNYKKIRRKITGNFDFSPTEKGAESPFSDADFLA